MAEGPPKAALPDNIRGIFWMVAAALCMSIMHALVRHVSAGQHPFEIVFFRLLFSVIVTVPWFVRLGWQPLKTDKFGLMVVRGVLNLACMMAFFFALSIAPLAEVVALMFTAPIFTTMLAMVVFGEVVGLRRWSAIAVGFLGTLVILRPGFEDIGLGPMLVLFAAFVWGTTMIVIKQLGRTESSVTITIYMTVIMAPLSLVPASFVWQWPTMAELGWLLAIGLVGGAGQMAIAQALKVAETHAIMPMEFTKLIWISIIAYFAFGEVPGIYIWIGGAMIFGSTAFIAYRERALRAPPTPKAEPT